MKLIFAAWLFICCIKSFAQTPALIVQRPHQQTITYMQYNKSNGLLYTISASEGVLKIWNPKYGKLIKEVSLSTKGADLCYLAPHGGSLIMYKNDQIYLLGPAGDSIGFYSLKGEVESTADPETGNIAVFGRGGKLTMLDTRTAKARVLLSPAGDNLVHCMNAGGWLTCANKHTAYVFDMHSGALADSINLPEQNHYSLSETIWYTDAARSRMALLINGRIQLMTPGTHDTIASYNFPGTYWTASVHPSPGLEKLVNLFGDTIRILDLHNGRVNTAQAAGLVSYSNFWNCDTQRFQVEAGPLLLLYSWNGGAPVFRAERTIDDIVHLCSQSVSYVLSHDHKVGYRFFEDTLMAYNLETGKLQKKAAVFFKSGGSLHENSIRNICTDDAGNIYLSGINDAGKTVIQIWDAATLQYKGTFPQNSNDRNWWLPESVVFDKSGVLCIATINSSYKMWDAKSGTVSVHPEWNNILAYNDSLIITEEKTDTAAWLTAYNRHSGILLKRTALPAGKINDFILPSGVIIGQNAYLPSNYSTIVYKWNLNNENIKMLETQGFSANSCKAEGKYLLIFPALLGKIGILNTTESNAKFTFYDASALTIFPPEKLIAVIKPWEYKEGIQDCLISIRQTKLGTEIQQIHYRSNDVPQRLCFSPDGNYLALKCIRSLWIWRKRAGMYEPYFQADGDYYQIFTSCMFSSRSDKLYYTTSTRELSVVYLSQNTAAKPSTAITLIGAPIGIASGPDHICILEEGNIAQVFNNRDNSYKYAFIDLGDNEWQIITPEGYYYSARHVAQNVGYALFPKYYGFENFDLIYNRPDIVLKSLGCENMLLLEAINGAVSRRRKRLNVHSGNREEGKLSVPQVSIANAADIPANTASDDIEIEVAMASSESPIVSWNVLVNDVPVFGAQGRPVVATTRLQEKIRIPLSVGANKIQVYCRDQQDVYSLKEGIFIQHITSSPPASHTIFIGIAAERFRDSSMNLHYAAKDIHDLASAFKKKFPDADTITMYNEQVTRANIAALKNILMKTAVEDRVITAFSGHGMLDDSLNFYCATWDVNFDNPRMGGLPYEALEGLLDSIPARKKLLLIDACQSGEVDKEGLADNPPADKRIIENKPEGARAPKVLQTRSKLGLQNSFVLMQELFADLSANSGTVVISAAGGQEYALEETRYKNGVFTYCIKQALEDKKQMSVGELKDYVSVEVSTLTGGRQKPTARRENLEWDWAVW